MKKEEVLEALGTLSPELIKEAEEAVPRKRSWLRYAVPAAALLAVALIVMWAVRPKTSGQDDSLSPEQRLLAAVKGSEGQAQLNVSIIYLIPVGKRIACYEEQYVGPPNVPIISPEYAGSTAVLQPFVGEAYLITERGAWHAETPDNPQEWFHVKDMEELKYLISRDSEGRLRLWKFDHFEMIDSYEKEARAEIEERFRELLPDCDLSPYTYGDVYELIYHVKSAADIQSVTAAAPNLWVASTPEYRIQKEIGEKTISDSTGLQQFFDCTQAAVFHGSYGWVSFYRLEERFTYSFSDEKTSEPMMDNDPYSSVRAIRAGRFLTVTLKSGTTIDDWKYQALIGIFWQWGGLTSDPLPERDVMTLNELFGIH